jgi:tRNA (guanine10-N2)-methyltransferase
VELNLAPNKAKQLCKRCVLLKRMYELWSQGTDLQSAIEALNQTIDDENITYAFTVTALYAKLDRKKQQDIRERVLDRINPAGKVNLKTPDVTIYTVLVYGEESCEPPTAAKDSIKFVITDKTKNKWRKLTHVYIGRDLGEGRRDLVHKFSLKKRPFLGPTSTDAELAFLMANQAQCKPGSIVIDTFVGTGSILIPLSYFGAHCIGT